MSPLLWAATVLGCALWGAVVAWAAGSRGRDAYVVPTLCAVLAFLLLCGWTLL